MSVSDKLITEEIGQVISLLEGVLNRLHKMTQPAQVAEPAAIDKFLEPAKPKPATLEDVRAALTELAGVKGAATTKTLLAEYDAKKLSDVPADKYASLLADAKAWAND